MSEPSGVSNVPGEDQDLELLDKQDIANWIKPEAPEEVKEQILSALVLQSHSMVYKAPIPPAVEFRKYEDVLEGSADRILGMAEKSLELRGEGPKVTRRHINATTMTALGMIVLTAYLAWLGLGVSVIVPLGLSGIITFFLREIMGLFSHR